jgi:hypothetical protein
MVRQGLGSTGVNLVTNPLISNEQGKDLIVVEKNDKRDISEV